MITEMECPNLITIPDKATVKVVESPLKAGTFKLDRKKLRKLRPWFGFHVGRLQMVVWHHSRWLRLRGCPRTYNLTLFPREPNPLFVYLCLDLGPVAFRWWNRKWNGR